MAWYVWVGVGIEFGVGAEFEAIGNVVAVGARQSGDIGFSSGVESVTFFQGNLGNASTRLPTGHWDR